MAWFRRQLWAELVAALLFGLNLLLMGLPGALIVSPIAAVLSELGITLSQPDAVWPASIWAGMLMPVGFLLAAMRGARRHPNAPFEIVSWGILGYLATGIVAGLIFLMMLSGR